MKQAYAFFADPYNPYNSAIWMPELNGEAIDVLVKFVNLLLAVTADGGKKRADGLKPHWSVDTSHQAALFSHLSKWKHGERRDADSGAHPLVHLAWRALAIAWQESQCAS
jgi:hypothetical protein